MTDKQYEQFGNAVLAGKLPGRRGMSLAEYAQKYNLSPAQLADLKKRRAAYDQRAVAVEGGGK